MVSQQSNRRPFRAAAVVAGVLLGLASPAAASAAPQADEFFVQTSVLSPSDPDDKVVSNPPDLTMLEVNRRRHGMYAVADSKQFASDPKARPRTAATSFWDECLKKKPVEIDAKAGWLKNHYDYCARGKVRLIFQGKRDNGTIYEKGRITLPFIGVGEGSKTERRVKMTFRFEADKVTRSGEIPANAEITMTAFCKGFNGVDKTFGASKTCKMSQATGPGEPVTLTKKVSDWLANSDLELEANSDAAWVDADPKAKAFGSREKVAVANLGMQFNGDVPGWSHNGSEPFMGWQTSVRFDSAEYLKAGASGENPSVGGEGAVFYDIIPSLEYDYQDKTIPNPADPSKPTYRGVHEVAAHIWQAFVSPDTTTPPDASKLIPGASNNLGDTLGRLYWDQGRRDANYNKSKYNCDKYFGTDPEKECDEFPFQSTYEGSAWHKYNPSIPDTQFSVKLISKHDNGEAGTRLSRWYSNDRILDWNWTVSDDLNGKLEDDFFVRIANPPAP
ncbi:NucA/NucB deoxyribonuclease domain-containing protein [Actinomadura coerulea]|uniref:NucA/NucB deoxyribonuclease domain-containing protein n=1 Tax=Actinomadura coerulea TaxID=46159 RepID=UPI00342C3190